MELPSPLQNEEKAHSMKEAVFQYVSVRHLLLN